MIACGARLEVVAPAGVPFIEPGDDVAALVVDALGREGVGAHASDVVVVSSKVVARAEGRLVDLATVTPSSEALRVAGETGKDPRLVELILAESTAISRKARGVLVVRHRLGFVAAHAGIDASNVAPRGAAASSGPWVLLLPSDPDGAAREIRARVRVAFGVDVGVIVSDSFGRPFRVGTVGAAIGVAGVPAIWDQRGESDLFGRKLEITMTALADQLAATADLVAGQGAEGRPFVVVRGLAFEPTEASASELLRPLEGDLYA